MIELARLYFGEIKLPSFFLYERILLQVECLCSQNSHIETLIPKVMVFGHEVWEIIRSYSGSPHDGITAL